MTENIKTTIKSFSLYLALSLWALGLIAPAQAALNVVGGSFVNDTDQNIVWLQDANMFKTLCDANDPIYTGWTGAVNNTEEAICMNNGQMSWNDAEAWIARLNSQNYLGFSDWRQPSTAQPDASCESQTSDMPPQDFGFNCTGSELGYLFNTALGNPNDAGTGATGGMVGSGCGPNCFINTAPFSNAQSSVYWSGTEFAPDSTSAWRFSTGNGNQGFGNKGGLNGFVWPVRSGQIDDTPIPTLSQLGLLMLVGLLGLMIRRWADRVR